MEPMAKPVVRQAMGLVTGAGMEFSPGDENKILYTTYSGFQVVTEAKWRHQMDTWKRFANAMMRRNPEPSDGEQWLRVRNTPNGLGETCQEDIPLGKGREKTWLSDEVWEATGKTFGWKQRWRKSTRVDVTQALKTPDSMWDWMTEGTLRRDPSDRVEVTQRIPIYLVGSRVDEDGTLLEPYARCEVTMVKKRYYKNWEDLGVGKYLETGNPKHLPRALGQSPRRDYKTHEEGSGRYSTAQRSTGFTCYLVAPQGTYIPSVQRNDPEWRDPKHLLIPGTSLDGKVIPPGKRYLTREELEAREKDQQRKEGEEKALSSTTVFKKPQAWFPSDTKKRKAGANQKESDG